MACFKTLRAPQKIWSKQGFFSAFEISESQFTQSKKNKVEKNFRKNPPPRGIRIEFTSGADLVGGGGGGGVRGMDAPSSEIRPSDQPKIRPPDQPLTLFHDTFFRLTNPEVSTY